MPSSLIPSPAQSANPAPLALPAPQAPVAETVAAEASAPVEAQVSATSVDADGDGHDDNNGQFVDGNTEAANPLAEVIDIEMNLVAAVEGLLAAATAFAEVPETPRFLLVKGYRLQFAGNDLMTLTVN